MTSTMRAAVSSGPNQIGVEALPVPEPGPGDARVRIEACGICGSDLHLQGVGALPPGMPPGHEMMGEVDTLGVRAPPNKGIDGFRGCDDMGDSGSGLHVIVGQPQPVEAHENEQGDRPKQNKSPSPDDGFVRDYFFT